MRLFVALRPPLAAREHLAAAVAGVPTTRAAQWHVTLAFLGDAVEDRAALHPGLRAAAAGVPPLRLRLAGGGSFRGEGVQWAGLAGDVDLLRCLAARVQRACRDAGVPLEHRRYRPHLTVARHAPPGLLHGYVGPAWTVTEVELVHSVLGAQARHQVLEHFRLGG